MAHRTPRRLCVSHSTFKKVDFNREGTGQFRSPGKQIWKLHWNEHKTIA